jgi:ribosomal protein S18 acetylase RimI-like enzyme
MSPVPTVSHVLDAIQQAKAGATAFCTNFFPAQPRLQAWIDHHELFALIRDRAAFFFRKERDFFHFYFAAASPEVLRSNLLSISQTERLIADLVGNEAALASLIAELKTAGFRPYRSLSRLSRSAQPTESQAAAKGSQVTFAESADRDAIINLLEKSFDPYADQIPLPYEIEAAIQGRQIFAIKCEGALAALLFFETQGFTSTVRYWVVANEFQSRGFGSALIRHYFAAQSAVRRFILWVTVDNENAVQKYRHYGYNPDGLVDNVLVNSLVPV